MRRLAIVLAVVSLLVAACGDSGDSADDTTATGTPAGGSGDATTITVPAGDGSDITVIQGGQGTAAITIGSDNYTVPLDGSCVVTSDNILVSGETEEIAFGLVTGVGLAMTLEPNTPDESVAYVIPAPEVTVSGSSVTGSGEAQGVSATGFGDTVAWTISLTC